jgi:hypothetical protein
VSSSSRVILIVTPVLARKISEPEKFFNFENVVNVGNFVRSYKWRKGDYPGIFQVSGK